MQLIALSEPFNGRDLLLPYLADASYTGTLRLSIDQHRTGAALALAAPVLASRQVEMLSQHSKQTSLWIDVYCIRFLINRQPNRSHSELQKRELRCRYS